MLSYHSTLCSYYGEQNKKEREKMKDTTKTKEEQAILEIDITLSNNEVSADEVLEQVKAIKESHEKGQTEPFEDF